MNLRTKFKASAVTVFRNLEVRPYRKLFAACMRSAQMKLDAIFEISSFTGFGDMFEGYAKFLKGHFT